MSSEKQRLLARGTFAVILGATLLTPISACKPKVVNDSELRDLNAGQALSDDSLFDDPTIRKKKVVLIYYANDTYAPTTDDPAFQNKEAMVRKIKSGLKSTNVTDAQKQALTSVASRIDEDWNNFRRTIDVDARYLTQEICKGNPRYQMGLAVFRNFGNDISGQGISALDYDRPFSWTYCQEGRAPQVATMKAPYFNNDFRYNSQPLSHPYMFKRALEEVMTKFPPGIYRYVLITKAHGSRDIAIGPMIGTDVRTIDDKDVWSSLISNGTSGTGLESDKMTTPILESDKMTTPILATGDLDEKLQQVAAQMNSAGLPYPPGVSKDDYLTALFTYAGGDPRLGMYLPIVFMESCKSDLAYSSSWVGEAVRAHAGKYAGLSMENVGYLYTSDEKGLPYNTIDFKLLFGPMYSKYSDFQDAFKAYMDSKAKKPVAPVSTVK